MFWTAATVLFTEMPRSFSQGRGAIIQHTFHTSLLQPTQPYVQHCTHTVSQQQQQQQRPDAAHTRHLIHGALDTGIVGSSRASELQPHTPGYSVTSSKLNILKLYVRNPLKLIGYKWRWKEECVRCKSSTLKLMFHTQGSVCMLYTVSCTTSLIPSQKSRASAVRQKVCETIWGAAEL